MRKQLAEFFSITKKDKKNLDVMGMIISVALVGIIVAVFVLVFKNFIEMYSSIEVGRVLDVKARQYEILTLVYGLMFVINIFGGIKALNFSIFESNDLKIFMYMPIKSTTLFLSKLLSVYVIQVLSAAIIIIPVSLTFGIVTHQTMYYTVMSVIMCFVLPLLTLSVAAVFAFPYYYIKRLIQSKYLLILIISTLILALVFVCYSFLLDFIKNMLVTGEIKAFFGDKTMASLGYITKMLFPANMFSNILLKQNVGMSWLWLILTIFGGVAIGMLVVSTMFVKISQEKIAGNTKAHYRTYYSCNKKTVVGSLIHKEFIDVLRTPGYAFQYFSTAIIMPLMVYFCMSIGSSLINTMVLPNGGGNFALAIFVVVLFSVLTNTFCSTNISREGTLFYTLKTLPCSHHQIVSAKIIFCSIVSGLAVTISCVLVGVLGYTDVYETLFLLLVTLIISFSQICFATRMDLNHPHFSLEPDGEIKESNKTISALILIGIFIALLLGASILFCTIYFMTKNEAQTGKNLSMAISAGISAILLVSSLTYLMVGLKKKFYKLNEGV